MSGRPAFYCRIPSAGPGKTKISEIFKKARLFPFELGALSSGGAFATLLFAIESHVIDSKIEYSYVTEILSKDIGQVKAKNRVKGYNGYF